MLIGIRPWDISVEFGDALIVLSLGAIAVFLSIAYIEEITVSISRLLRFLNPRALSARFRLWWLLHRATH